jgi:hypothetical protein
VIGVASATSKRMFFEHDAHCSDVAYDFVSSVPTGNHFSHWRHSTNVREKAN